LVTPIDVNPGPANSFAGADGGFAAFHGSLYFSADTPATGEDLFRLDAGSTTPVPVEIDPGAQSSFAGEDSGFGVFNQTLYFNAFSAADGQSELFSLAAGSSTPSVVRDAGNHVITHQGGLASSFQEFAGKLYTDDDNPAGGDTLIAIGADGIAAPIQ